MMNQTFQNSRVYLPGDLVFFTEACYVYQIGDDTVPLVSELMGMTVGGGCEPSAHKNETAIIVSAYKKAGYFQNGTPRAYIIIGSQSTKMGWVYNLSVHKP
jgi:hypothetical protein